MPPPAPPEENTSSRKGRFSVVMLADVVGFTRLRTEDQVRVRGHIQQIVGNAMEQHRGATLHDGPLARMTGDGFYFATFDYPEDLLQSALTMQTSLKGGDFAMRVGLNAGIGFVMPDEKGGRDLVGDAINMASRIMSAGGPGHILASRAFYDLLRNTRFGGLFHGTGSLTVKHGEKVEVYNVFDDAVGNRSPPRVTEGQTSSADTMDSASAEAAVDGVYLLAMNGPRFGEALPVRGTAILGRAKECDVVLDDRTVSRQHCRIEARRSEVRLHDYGSANGTLVNGNPMSECMLETGDVVTVGHQYFRFLRIDPARLGAARDDEMRRIAHEDERTGFLRYGHFVDRVEIELDRARESRRRLWAAAFSSPVVPKLEESPRADVIIGLFWQRALKPLRAELRRWDAMGSTISLQVVYALVPERAHADDIPLALERAVGRADAAPVDVLGRAWQPELRWSIAEAKVAGYPTPNELLAQARRGGP